MNSVEINDEIRNIIFDLGNVLIAFRPDEFLIQFTTNQRKIKSFMTNVIRSETWLKLDRGTISVESARAWFIEHHSNLEGIIHHFFENWMDLFVPIKTNTQIFYDLVNEGYNCYYLSNFIEEAFRYVFSRFFFFSSMKGGIISARVKTIKPEPTIYKLLLDSYNLKAEECIFVDDTPEFLLPAQKLGMSTITHSADSDLRQELNNLGILV